MTLSELAVKISVQGADSAKRGVIGVRDALGDAAARARDFATHGAAVGSVLKNMAIGATVTAAALGFAGVQLAIFGFNGAKSMDSLTRGLASVSVNADDLRGQLARLREVAKLPGLGFEEAVKGSLALQAAGLSAELSERSLKAFGNALATVGRGKADLDGVTLALSQIASKGKVSAEEINQINERVPQIRAAMNAVFGTADGDAINKMGVDTTAFISQIVGQLEKLPRVSGGVGNAIENLQDKLQAALLPLGKGLTAMFEAAAPGLEKLLGVLESRMTAIGEVFQAVGKSGVLAETLGSLLGLTDGIGDFKDGAIDAVATVLTVFGNIPAAIKQVQGYATELFRVLGANAASIGEYIGARFAEIWGRVGEFIETAVGGLLGTIGDIGNLIGNLFPMLGGMLKEIAKLTFPGQVMLGAAAILQSDIPLPKLEGLPGLPNVMDTLGAGRDEKAARIRAAMSPLSDLPDGLNYGGKAGGAAAAQSPVVAALNSIETNTRETADALSLRRQTLGGGELGNLGVTASELFGGNPTGRSGNNFGASTGDQFNQIADLLRRAVDAQSRAQLANAGAGTFRPR